MSEAGRDAVVAAAKKWREGLITAAHAESMRLMTAVDVLLMQEAHEGKAMQAPTCESMYRPEPDMRGFYVCQESAGHPGLHCAAGGTQWQ